MLLVTCSFSYSWGLPIIYLIFGNTAHLNHEVTVQLAVILIQSLAVQSFGLFISKNSGSSGSAPKAIVLTLRMPQPLDSYSKQSRSISRISFSGLHWNISTRWSWAFYPPEVRRITGKDPSDF
jgi:hypothetical protein